MSRPHPTLYPFTIHPTTTPMIPCTVTPNIEAAPWKDDEPTFKQHGLGTITRIGRLPRGTSGGKSTVTVMVQMPDGTKYAAQTTLALWNAATVAMNANAQERGEE